MKKIILTSLVIIMVLGTFNFAIPKAKAVVTNTYTGGPTYTGSYIKNNIHKFLLARTYIGGSSPLSGGTLTGTLRIGGVLINNSEIGCSRDSGDNQLTNIYNQAGTVTAVMPNYPANNVTVDINLNYTNASYNLTWIWSGTVNMDSTGNINVYNTILPLTATISGPTSVDLVSENTWTSEVTGGLTPYTYIWRLGKFPPQWIYTIGNEDITEILTEGNWTISLTVTDSLETSVTTSISVTAGTVAGAYTAHLTRSGALGNIIDIYVTDVTNTEVTISSTSNTKLGYFYATDSTYRMDDAIAEAVQYVTYTWRWTTQMAIPPDMWFYSSVHLAVPNIDLLITKHFLTFNDGAVIVFGPTGEPTVPVEIPPPIDHVLPAWLQDVYDMFVKVLRYLFEPNSSDFSKQISGGWLDFESPIPAITKSYTIALPKLAMIDGEPGTISHNFSFAWIKDVSGFSIYQTVFHALAYAILIYTAFTIFM